jgi:hypothetical protein
MTKFAVAASAAVFMLGVVAGRITAPAPAMAAEAKASMSIDELTRNAGPLKAESYDAV